MAFNGTRLFRYALLMEAAANVGGAIPMLLSPDTFLKLVVTGPNMINPATRSFTQWFAGMTLALTVPLLFSYPNPRPSHGGGPQVVPWRRMTYITLAMGEVALGSVMAAQFMIGDSGLTDNALLGGMALMGGIAAMRGFFLYVQPSWMAAQENSKKAQ